MLFCLSLAAAGPLAERPQGPEDIVLPYDTSPDSAALWEADRALLAHYAKSADTVIVGRIVATRPDWEVFGEGQIATVLIEERIIGDAVGLVEFRVPLVREAGSSRPALIDGYRLLLFLDSSDNVVDGAAVFFVEGGHVWRNRRDEVFLRPSIDRAWASEMDPLDDYVSLSLEEVRHATTATAESRRSRWRRGG
jgi:hypothetical protein